MKLCLIVLVALGHFIPSKSEDQKEWILVAEKAECEGPGWPYEEMKGYLSDVDSCAEACKGTSSMFTFGANDFGHTNCRSHFNGCTCTCELLAHPNGTCKEGTSGSPGYRLYKIKKGDESTGDNLWQGIEFINTEEGKYCQDHKRGDYGTDLKCQRQCEEWNNCVGISVSHPTSSCFLCKTDILEVAPWGIKDWVFRQPKDVRLTCTDGKQNQGESGVDCGGPCDACGTCTDEIQNQGETGTDCGGPCDACPTCDDGIQNQDETGIDCGGACDACPTCDDEIQNQDETGIDCGGACDACPTCDDEIQNQDETGIDCGGACDACPTCNDGVQNQDETGIDCGGGCDTCPTCDDGIQNQEETGIDCGGPCPACKLMCKDKNSKKYCLRIKKRKRCSKQRFMKKCEMTCNQCN